jgi:hypothetical protein
MTRIGKGDLISSPFPDFGIQIFIWFTDDGFFGDYEPYKDKFKRTQGSISFPWSKTTTLRCIAFVDRLVSVEFCLIGLFLLFAYYILFDAIPTFRG